MTVRKQISGGQRLAALGYGTVGIIVALLIAKHGDFEWSAAVALVIGIVGGGGIYRFITGYDEI